MNHALIQNSTKRYYPTQTNEIISKYKDAFSPSYLVPINEENKMEKFDTILHYVCKFYLVEVADVLGNKRTELIKNARHTVVFITKKLLNISLTKIGQLLGGKDHATMINSIKRINNYIFTKDVYGKNAQFLLNTLQQKLA